jgi:hypothetical protein
VVAAAAATMARFTKAPLTRMLSVIPGAWHAMPLRCAAFLMVLMGGLVPASAGTAEDVLAAPSLPPYQWFASTDPKHSNEDYLTLQPGQTRRIPLAAGRLERLWCTALQPDKIVLKLQNSGETVLLRDNKALIGSLYRKAYTLYPSPSTQAATRILKSGAMLVVTNRDVLPNKFFYQIAVRNSPPRHETTIKSSGEIASFRVTIAPSGERTWQLDDAVSDLSAPVIDSLSIQVSPNKLSSWQNLHLRITWDSGSKNAVDVSLLALTGQFFAMRPMRSNLVDFDGKTLTLRWPMPYGSDTKMSFANSGPETIHLLVKRKSAFLPSPLTAYRFCAREGSSRTQKSQPVQMLNVTGQGAFVGLALGIKPAPDSTRRTFAFLEGNETITADGKTYEGTGTEDFFNSAWYFPDEPFSMPYHGLTYKSQSPPQVSAYHFMIPDAIPFRKTLNFAFEHGKGNNSDDLEYRWVAFWYQKPPLKSEVANSLDTGGRTAQDKTVSGRVSTGTQGSLWVRFYLAALGAVLCVAVIRFVARLARR